MARTENKTEGLTGLIFSIPFIAWNCAGERKMDVMAGAKVIILNCEGVREMEGDHTR